MPTSLACDSELSRATRQESTQEFLRRKQSPERRQHRSGRAPGCALDSEKFLVPTLRHRREQQTVLRHSAVSTTMADYVIPDQKEISDAMRKFDEFLATLESNGKQHGARSSTG
jgi:hypothetical protein